MKKILLGLLFTLVSTQLHAQSRVVTTCGTLPQTYSPGSSQPPTVDINGNACAASTGATGGVVLVPSASPAAGITPVVSAAAEAAHVLKAAPGNLYSVYALNFTNTPGFLAIVNLTADPGNGQAILPLDCAPLPANGSTQINFVDGPPNVYSVGITAVITSAANCFTETTGVITGYISGRVK